MLRFIRNFIAIFYREQLRLKLEKLVKEETLQAKRKYKFTSDTVNPGFEQVQGGDSDDQQRAQEIKKKFRSMEEIRADLEELEVKQESDFSVMSRVLSVAVDHMKLTSERLNALADLEFYLHQVCSSLAQLKLNVIKNVNVAQKPQAIKLKSGCH